MDAKSIKEMLSEEDITELLVELGSAYPKNSKDALMFTTICHGGDSSKLYYYPETHTFRCYTHCSCNYDVFSLVEKVLEVEFNEAFNYICNMFNIKKGTYVGKEGKIDNSFRKKFRKTKEVIELEEYDKYVLRNFDEIYHHSWLEDGISIYSMQKYNILYHILNNKIIIPFYDKDEKLIGIRGRALNQHELDEGYKYMPITFNGQLYNFPTGLVFYGMNISKENISEKKKVILFEGEKSCMQLDTMCIDESFLEGNISLGISGSSLSDFQVEQLAKMGVEEVILGLDKEYTEIGSKEEKEYRKKVHEKFVRKLQTRFTVSVLYDTEGLLGYKDSPTDKGKDVFEHLFKNRLYDLKINSKYL